MDNDSLDLIGFIAASVVLFMAWAVHAFVEAVSEFNAHEGTDDEAFEHSEGGTEL